MTDYAKLVKRLRQDAPTALVNCDFDFVAGWIEEAADAIDQLVQIHQLDLSELVRLRRQIQALMEDRSAEHCSAEEAAHA